MFMGVGANVIQHTELYYRPSFEVFTAADCIAVARLVHDDKNNAAEQRQDN